MRLAQQEKEVGQGSASESLTASKRSRVRQWFADDAGAIAIEYVIVAIALLAIAGAIAAALTTLGDDAVSQIPASVSEAGG